MLFKFLEFLVRLIAKDSFSSYENRENKDRVITCCTNKIEECEKLREEILSYDDDCFPVPLGTVIIKNNKEEIIKSEIKWSTDEISKEDLMREMNEQKESYEDMRSNYDSSSN